MGNYGYEVTDSIHGPIAPLLISVMIFSPGDLLMLSLLTNTFRFDYKLPKVF